MCLALDSIRSQLEEQVWPAGGDRLRCYTALAVKKEVEDYFLNPPPGSAAARAVEFGIDLTLTLENLRLTPEERIQKLDEFILGVARLKASARRLGPRDAADNQNY